MYHIFIHSSVDGHLGFFRVLAIVNGIAMNNGVHVSFWFIAFSGYMPRRGIYRFHWLLIKWKETSAPKHNLKTHYVEFSLAALPRVLTKYFFSLFSVFCYLKLNKLLLGNQSDHVNWIVTYPSVYFLHDPTAKETPTNVAWQTPYLWVPDWKPLPQQRHT